MYIQWKRDVRLAIGLLVVALVRVHRQLGIARRAREAALVPNLDVMSYCQEGGDT